MLKLCCLLLILFTTYFPLAAQPAYSTNPDSSLFVTTDIDLFWKTFDDFKKDTTTNRFGKNYIETGSAGVRGFLPMGIKSADNLYTVVKARREDYEKVRATTLRVREKIKQCRSTFYALKYWYPEAQYPPVYFVIGAFNAGGTFEEGGIFIGTELLDDLDHLPYMVAHEIIHFQQKNWAEYPTLLQQSIVEGSAEFLGELISGKVSIKKAYDYGERHKERLCREFVSRMDSTAYIDWMYGVTGKDDRPNDLGYWIGYKITEHYFKKATDKKQAIKDILDIKDYKAFLRKSGYVDQYLK